MTLVGPQIKADFGIRNEGYGWVLAAFSLTYALFQLPAGYLTDRGDVRRIYGWAVIWWSCSAAAMAFSPTLGVLLGLRAMLGVGESFNWPCALRATSAVLPPEDRGLGNGIFNSGAAVGAVLTPLIVPKLAERYGWRPTFVIVASLGIGWVFLWRAMAGGPHRGLFAGRPGPGRSSDDLGSVKPDRLSSVARRAFGAVLLISLLVACSATRVGRPAIWWAIATLMIGLLIAARLLPSGALVGADWAESLGEVVRLRRFWVLVVVSISVNVCWHFLVNWLPTYLQEDRGMSYLASGMLSSLPFLAADVGNLGGGAASRSLTRRGWSTSGARLVVMTFCSILIASGSIVGLIRDDRVAILLLGAMALGTAAFMANYFAYCQDVSSSHTGFVVGILGGLGNLFAAGLLPLAGHVRDISGSFGSIFALVGVLPFVGLGALIVGWGRARPGEVGEAG